MLRAALIFVAALVVAVCAGLVFLVVAMRTKSSNTDWLRNVLASGSAVLVTNGQTCAVDHPQVVATADAKDEFPPKEQRTHRWFGVSQCLRLHLVEANDATAQAAEL